VTASAEKRFAGEPPRSPHWDAARKAWVKGHPACAVCGTRDNIDVHHVHPFHLFPEMELDPANFMTLCRHDHLLFGHLGDFKAWNPVVRDMVAVMEVSIKGRKYGR
jgi:5-methylcytosine-specific restriction protein A